MAKKKARNDHCVFSFGETISAWNRLYMSEVEYAAEVVQREFP